MKRTAKCKPIGNYEPTSAAIRAWIEKKMPTIDIDETFELFRDKAEANAWEYANWDAAFRNYLRKSDEWGGAVHINSMSDPRWRELIIEARAIEFRMPTPHESMSVYRSAMRSYSRSDAPGTVTDIFSARPAASPRVQSEPLRRQPGETDQSLRARASCDADYYALKRTEDTTE